ncbi:MAG: M48 family metalloprotease, partial [Planctomycetia bacterium]|nr:M48 family metalloprotease [Planctomycetia bacterium]
GCRAGDVARNGARNVFGRGGERAADLVGAFVQNEADLRDQMGIQFSPEQEYYLGRGVAAQAIARYGLDPDEARQRYVRLIGAALVEAAPRVRATYGGYHFAVLNSAEANGLSGPGGFVFVTRGAVERARNEDELAGVLAHEIAHVSLKHGEAVIRASAQWQTGYTNAFRIGAAAAGFSAREQNKLTGLFRDSVKGLADALANQGYGSAAEEKADREGAAILYEAGYDAGAITAYLKALPDRPQTNWSAHPDSASRVAALAPFVATYGGPFDGGVGAAVRAARFQTMLAPKSVAGR